MVFFYCLLKKSMKIRKIFTRTAEKNKGGHPRKAPEETNSGGIKSRKRIKLGTPFANFLYSYMRHHGRSIFILLQFASVCNAKKLPLFPVFSPGYKNYAGFGA